MEPEQIADVLDDAADYIEANGWFSVHPEHGHRDGLDAACALVAIDRADAPAPLSHLFAARALAEALGLDGPLCIPAWNNDPERIKQEVLDAFRAAAKQQRGLA